MRAFRQALLSVLLWIAILLAAGLVHTVALRG